MPQKPQARGSSRKTSATGKAKTQSERFIEAARETGVDETGKEFDRAMKRLIPPRRKKS